MAKHKPSQRYIFKINSSRLRRNNWELALTPHDARKNEELITLSESAILRFIDEIRGVRNINTQSREVRSQIKLLKKEDSYTAKTDIRRLYNLLDELQFVKDYMCVIVDNIKDYRYICKHGFTINDVKYERLLGTTGGVKSSTIVFVNEEIAVELKRRVENGRDETIPLIPAKLEAYKALACSSSLPVTQPKGLLVVDDVITTFKADVINLDDTEAGEPVTSFINSSDIYLNVSDGCGMIHPSLAEQWASDLGLDYLPSGFCTRNSWEKGMNFTFDFIDFAEKIAGSYIVKDIWGQEHDIRNIDLVLTASMLKLWDSYSSVDDYLTNCDKHGYTFSVTKVTPQELEKERNLNYQFIQSFRLTDKEIDELIQPTIDEIKEVLGNDYRKSILFLKGTHLDEHNISQVEDDYIKALMIDKEMINDPFVRSKIHFMIKKRINDAKTGVIKVHGNFSLISGDLYALCQHMFGLEVTGLLKAGEVYNEYWRNIDTEKVIVFRAPMTCHNNIRLLDVAYSTEANYWFRYMQTITILNSFDTTCDAMNGADKDGDIMLLTDNKVLINNYRELPTIMCVQRDAKKVIVTEDDLIQSNINSFGDEIGSTTNRITSMFEVQAKFPVDSLQHKTLDYRIACGQLFQQNSIDKSKGIIAKSMPKAWYSKYANSYSDTDTDEEKQVKDFNMSILADKKPYFMCYIYPSLMTDYNKYVSNGNKSSIMRFGMNLEDLNNKSGKTVEEISFLDYYNSNLPVGMSECVVNKIAWRFENEFNDYLKKTEKCFDFDYSILKSDAEYTKKMHSSINKLYEQYKKQISYLAVRTRKTRMRSDIINSIREQMKLYFIRESSIVCPSVDVLCNIVIDLCYQSKNSKQFTWDVCGNFIINNMLEKNNNTISYPTREDNNPEFYYCGEGYRMEQYTYHEERLVNK